MKIILKEDVKNVGQRGEEVNVADGYGRNFLLPRELAVLATVKNVKQLNHHRKLMEDRNKKELKAARDFAEKLTKINCALKRKSGEEGKLFGSVTSQDIADHLKEVGIDIDRKKIHLEEPLKSLGTFRVPLKLHSEVTVDLKVTVEKE
ncbi:MAG: 50S ribosomal protein L9 [Nitrospinae bacterium]|nr:50S ribosomal protein L9 [Nitrospinota bacterium]